MEIVFVMSAAVILHRRMKGLKLPVYTTAGFVFGVVVVTWGNIRVSLDLGIEGILLGLAVPIAVVLAEGIFSEAVRRSEQQEPTPEPEPQTEQSKEKPTKEDKKPFPEPMPLRSEPMQTDQRGQRTIRRTPAQTMHTISHTNTHNSSRINPLLDEKELDFILSESNLETLEICADYIKENGKRPSIRGLAKLAGTKENRSRRVIDIIKSIQQQDNAHE
jgi:hypothetical protein